MVLTLLCIVPTKNMEDAAMQQGGSAMQQKNASLKPSPDLNYFRKPLGILKAAEFVVVLLCLIIVGSVRNIAGTG